MLMLIISIIVLLFSILIIYLYTNWNQPFGKNVLYSNNFPCNCGKARISLLSHKEFFSHNINSKKTNDININTNPICCAVVRPLDVLARWDIFQPNQRIISGVIRLSSASYGCIAGGLLSSYDLNIIMSYLVAKHPLLAMSTITNQSTKTSHSFSTTTSKVHFKHLISHSVSTSTEALPLLIFPFPFVRECISIVSREDDQTFLTVIENQLNHEFQPGQPMWRLVLVQKQQQMCQSSTDISVTVANNHNCDSSFEIIICMQHTIADGMSVPAFFSAFLDELFAYHSVQNQILNCNTMDSSVINVSCLDSRCFPPCELLSDLRPSLSQIYWQTIFLLPLFLPKFAKISAIVKSIFTRKNDNDENKMYIGPRQAMDTTKFKTKLLLLHISSSLLSRLHERCREEKVTIHGALVAAAQFSVFIVNNEKKCLTSCTTPISMRPKCIQVESTDNNHNVHMPLSQQLGLFVADWDGYQLITEDNDFFQTARDYLEMLNSPKISSTRGQMIGLRDYVGNISSYHSYYANSFLNGRMASCEVSNLGKVKLQSAKLGASCLPYSIDFIAWGQGAHYPGGVFCNSVCTWINEHHESPPLASSLSSETKDGLFDILSYPSVLIHEDDAQLYVHSLKTILHFAATSISPFSLKQVKHKIV